MTDDNHTLEPNSYQPKHNPKMGILPEKNQKNPNLLRTVDGLIYERMPNGSLRRLTPKSRRKRN